MGSSPQTLPLTPLSTAILLALAEEELHGYALMQRVDEQSRGILQPGTGTLYAALVRLLDDGLIEEGDEPATNARRGRSYRISEAGRALVRAEAARMARVVALARSRGLAPEGDLAAEGGR